MKYYGGMISPNILILAQIKEEDPELYLEILKELQKKFDDNIVDLKQGECNDRRGTSSN